MFRAYRRARVLDRAYRRVRMCTREKEGLGTRLPAKVHVWNGISCRGATQVVIFAGIMNATHYTHILEAALSKDTTQADIVFNKIMPLNILFSGPRATFKRS